VFRGDSENTESQEGERQNDSLPGTTLPELCQKQKNKQKKRNFRKITFELFGFQHRRPRADHCEAWAVCGLGGVSPRCFYSYSILHQFVISTGYDYPVVYPTAITSYQHGPTSAKPFLSLMLD